MCDVYLDSIIESYPEIKDCPNKCLAYNANIGMFVDQLGARYEELNLASTHACSVLLARRRKYFQLLSLR